MLCNAFYTEYRVGLWKIHERKIRDKWGHYEDHKDFEFELHDTYDTDVPPDRRAYSMAVRYAKEWGMSPVAVLDMSLADFVELSAANRATTLRRPWFEDEERGHNAMIWERQFGHKTGKIRNPKYRKNGTEADDYGE